MGETQTSLLVNEIYRSIQGESSYVGLPCVFVRLTGCPLRCTYCDTEYAFHEGRRLRVEEVVDAVQAFGIDLVEVTGGEPLVQPACSSLVQRLLDLGHTVLVETSGALPIDRLPAGAIRIMDLKCPSSGEHGRNLWENVERLTPADEVKFVIGDRADYDWARAAIAAHQLTRRCTVLLSCVAGVLEPATLVEWILADRLPVRFQIQLHKVIWPAAVRGV